MAASRNSTSMAATMTSISPLSVPEHLFHCIIAHMFYLVKGLLCGSAAVGSVMMSMVDWARGL